MADVHLNSPLAGPAEARFSGQHSCVAGSSGKTDHPHPNNIKISAIPPTFPSGLKGLQLSFGLGPRLTQTSGSSWRWRLDCRSEWPRAARSLLTEQLRRLQKPTKNQNMMAKEVGIIPRWVYFWFGDYCWNVPRIVWCSFCEWVSSSTLPTAVNIPAGVQGDARDSECWNKTRTGIRTRGHFQSFQTFRHPIAGLTSFWGHSWAIRPKMLQHVTLWWPLANSLAWQAILYEGYPVLTHTQIPSRWHAWVLICIWEAKLAVTTLSWCLLNGCTKKTPRL